ncbi:alpha/beta hydrolase [Chitinophaga sp. Hz27]|uniref:alpha/beta hydrolase n=1 Tax=Chitinophaga sp. Hz27 TaxID=3347169 RepID=UPI0035D746C3
MRFIFTSLLIVLTININAQTLTDSAYVLHTSTGDLYGTLTYPVSNLQVPVMLLIAGSGPTDRNGNNKFGVRNDTYKQLADSLVQYGIATLRYDKRGIAASKAAMKSEAEMLFSTYADDAASFLHALKADKRFSKVYVAGHSEGSLIGMLAFEKEPVAGYISIAGTGENIGITLKKQIAVSAPMVKDKVGSMLDSLANGMHVWSDGSPVMQSLFRPSLQPYLISWLKYDPAVEIAKIDAPVLILQGTTDMHVHEEDAELLKKGNPKAALHIIAGMNHILKAAPADQAANLATYSDPKLPLNSELVRYITQFLK